MTEPLQPGVELALTIVRDSGTVDARYGTRPYAGAEFTEGRIRRGGWGAIRRGLSDDSGQPQMASASVVLNDDDEAIRTALTEDETRFLTQTDASITVLSEAGRAAALTPRTLMRGRVDDAKPEIGRSGHQRSRSVRLNLIDALAPYYDQTIPKQVFLRSDFPDIHRDLENTPIPLIGGEHSDYGATDVNGNSAEKGLVPAIYVGTYELIAGSPGGSPGAIAAFLTPPVITATVVGTPGTRTLYYAATKLSAVGETVIGAIVTVSNAPNVLTATDYVEIEIAAETEADVTGYNVYGRRNATPVRRLTTLAAGGSPISYIDDGSDPEFAPGPPSVNTAQVPLSGGGFFWHLYVVCLGVVEITGIYGSNVQAGVEPARVLLNATAGVDFLIPGMAGWPFADDFLTTASGLRYTGFLGRGPRSQHHIDGVVTIALSVCGYEDVGDGSGDSIQQAFLIFQHFLTQFVLQNYADGNWLPLATFEGGSPGTSILQTSSFAACQSLTVDWLGGSGGSPATTGGYKGAIYLREPITVREFIQWFCQTFDAFVGTNHHGQIIVALYDSGASVATGRLYRERLELLSIENPELDRSTVEPRILYQFDWDPDAQQFRSEILEVVTDPTAVTNQPRLAKDPQVKQLRWTRDADTANDAMQRRNARLKYPRWKQTIVGKYSPMLEDDLGDQFLVTHPDGPFPGGYVERPFFAVGHEIDPNAGVVKLTGYDLYPLLSGSP